MQSRGGRRTLRRVTSTTISRVALPLLCAPSAIVCACATSEDIDESGARPVDAGGDGSTDALEPDAAAPDAEAPDTDAPDTDAPADAADATTDGPPGPDADADVGADTGADAADTGACGADRCSIGGSCVDAGTPEPGDACRACLPTVSTTAWSSDPSNTTCGATAFWGGLARTAAMATSPYGHKTAISCHNCYASTLSATTTKITTAIADGADLIELDVREHSDGVTYVMHDEVTPPSGTPTLAQVLGISALVSTDRPLFIELKETAPTDAFVSGVLDALSSAGVAKANRPVFLRAFAHGSTVNNLLVARRLLATAKYASLRPHVRLSALRPKGDGASVSTLRTAIRAAKEQGFHMVELEYQSRNLHGGIAYAKSLGLATGIYTIPASLGEMAIANARDSVDEITVDYPIAKSRQVVQDANGLVFFDTAAQSATASTFSWLKASASPVQTSPLGAAGAPTAAVGGVGDALFGTSLAFVSAQSRYAALYDADNAASAGFLVAAAVKLDSLALAAGETKTIVGKADSAGFSLELFRPSSGSTVLRFGVHVNGAYEYATYPAASLNTTDSYLITGAYDGNGAVRLTIDNSEAGVTVGPSITGGVTQNDSLVLVGADPQTTSAPRFFFDGKLQMLTVQRWADH